MWTRAALRTTSRRGAGASYTLCITRRLTLQDVVGAPTHSFATVADATPAASTSAHTPAPSSSLKAGKKPARPPILTSVILNRAPVTTRTPTPFERAYYSYQQRIQRALHNPFPYDFYFKPGSLLESQFNLAEARRDRRAFGKGFGMDAEGAFTKPETLPDSQGEEEVLAARWTEADEKGDTHSLDRQGQRNLYLLLLKKQDGKQVWTLPTGDVKPQELLHEVGAVFLSQHSHLLTCYRPRSVTLSPSVGLT
jgi:large subunit ribosomal protein L46